MSGNDERAMRLFARLAAVAALKQQPIGRDRFLVLTGIAATRAGWPDVATRCHEIITSKTPKHIVCHYASFADALRDEDFQTFTKQVERFCSPERAELLLQEMQLQLPSPGDNSSAGDVALDLLKPITSS
ncbi:MAG: hypothetical protein R3C02_01955 [Planctomycetaceae bacterium]